MLKNSYLIWRGVGLPDVLVSECLPLEVIVPIVIVVRFPDASLLAYLNETALR